MKLCRKCGEVKRRSEFGKHKSKKDGLASNCRLCVAAYKAAYRDAKKEEIAAYMAAYRRANKKRIAAQKAAWREANKEYVSAQYAAYREKNKKELAAYQAAYRDAKKEDLAAYKAVYRDAKKEEIAAYGAKWRMANKEAIAAKSAAYKRANPHKVNAIGAKRRAAKLQATPQWLTQQHLDQIEALYRQAALMKRLGLGEYHVDHIVPLQGAEVRGLHVPWNLQVLPASQNLAKQNKLTA